MSSQPSTTAPAPTSNAPGWIARLGIYAPPLLVVLLVTWLVVLVMAAWFDMRAAVSIPAMAAPVIALALTFVRGQIAAAAKALASRVLKPVAFVVVRVILFPVRLLRRALGKWFAFLLVLLVAVALVVLVYLAWQGLTVEGRVAAGAVLAGIVGALAAQVAWHRDRLARWRRLNP
jgi:hypothetical protein